MALNDIWKITVVGQIHGQETNNVQHYRFTSEESTFAGIAAAIFDCIRTVLLPGLSNEWRVIEIRGKKLFPQATDESVIAALSTDVGGLNTEGLPSYCAALVSIKTGLAGRRNRGRFYLAGVPETGQTGSRLTNGELAIIVAFAACLANKFIVANNDFPYRLGVLSRKNVQGGASIGNAFRDGTVLTTTNVMATMRRRKIGVGS